MSLESKKIVLLFVMGLSVFTAFCQNNYDRINIYTQNSFMLPLHPHEGINLREEAHVFLSCKEKNFIDEFARFIPVLPDGSKVQSGNHLYMPYTIIDFLNNGEIVYTISLNEKHDYRLNDSGCIYEMNKDLWDLIVDTFPYFLEAWR